MKPCLSKNPNLGKYTFYTIKLVTCFRLHIMVYGKILYFRGSPTRIHCILSYVYDWIHSHNITWFQSLKMSLACRLVFYLTMTVLTRLFPELVGKKNMFFQKKYRTKLKCHRWHNMLTFLTCSTYTIEVEVKFQGYLLTSLILVRLGFPTNFLSVSPSRSRHNLYQRCSGYLKFDTPSPKYQSYISKYNKTTCNVYM